MRHLLGERPPSSPTCCPAWRPGALVRVAVLVTFLGSAGCLTLDDPPARARAEYGPFGEELYLVWLDELSRSFPAPLAPYRVAQLQEREAAVQEALTAVAADPVGSDDGLLALLQRPEVLVLWTDGTVDALLDAATAALATLRAGPQPGLQAATALLAASGGHNPAGPYRLGERLATQPEPLLTELQRLLVLHRDRVTTLHDLVGRELREVTAKDDEEAAPLLGPAVEELLLAPACPGASPEAAPTLEPRPDDCAAGLYPIGSREACRCDLAELAGARRALTVRVDAEGAPVPSRDESGALLPPLVDADGDGLPDRDRTGRYLLRGQDGIEDVRDVPALSSGLLEAGAVHLVRGPGGEALASDGASRPLFDYVDLHETLLGLGVTLLADLADEPASASGAAPLDDLLLVLPALLGPEILVDGQRAYDFSRSPLRGLLHGVLELLSYPELEELLARLAATVRQDPAALVQLVGELGRALRILRDSPAILAADRTVRDDLLGGNPLVELGLGAPCSQEQTHPLPCGPGGWLSCAADGVCRAAGPAPGLLEALADEADGLLLRDVLRLLATDEPTRRAPAGAAFMMAHLGTDVRALPLDAGLCPAETYIHGGGVLPAVLSASCWQGEVDRELSDLTDDPDSPARSAFQDLLALLYNTNRLVYVPVIADLPQSALTIRNGAGFYLDSVADRSRITPTVPLPDAALRSTLHQLLCELDLDDPDGDPLTPTAEQLNLWTLRDHDTGDIIHRIGNPLDHLGKPCREHHADMLVAMHAPWPAPRFPGEPLPGCDLPATDLQPAFVESLRPLVRLLAAYGLDGEGDRRGIHEHSAGGTQLFLDLLGTLHLHWATGKRCAGEPLRLEPWAGEGGSCPHGPDGVFRFDRQEGSGLRRLEPVFGRLVGETELFPALFRLLAAAEASGLNDALVPFLRWLLDRDAYGRDWQLPGEDPVPLLRGDRQTTEARPARAMMLLEPLRRLDEVLQQPGHEERRAAWERLDLVSLLWGPVGQEDAGRGRLLAHLLSGALDAAPRVLARAAADRDERRRWAADLEQDLGDLLGSPVFWQGLALWEELQQDVAAQSWLLAVVREVLARPEPTTMVDGRGALLETLLHLGRKRLAPATWALLAEAGGTLLGGERPLLVLLEQAGTLAAPDEAGILGAAGGNLCRIPSARPEAEAPLAVLLGAVAATLRLDPMVRGDLDAQDLAWCLARLELFLQDDVHGVGRIAQLVRER